MTPPRASSGCLKAMLITLVIGLLGVAGIAAIVGVAARAFRDSPTSWTAHHHSTDGGVDEFPDLRRTWSYGDGEIVAVRIPVYGILTRAEESGLFGRFTDPVGEVLACIQNASQDESVMAIILEVDSPGGEVTASDLIYKALLDFKQARPGRKVVALFENVAASGAFYIAMAADAIIAHPTTLTGSIGVLISALNAKALGDKIGVRDVTIKSGANKDLLNPLRDTTEEERALLQQVVDEMHDRFVSLVAKGRNLDESAVRPLADGRILTARQALAARFVDEIGYWDDAVRRTAQLVGAPEIKIFKYESRPGFFDLLRLSLRDRLSLHSLMETRSPRFLAIWNP